MSTPDERPPATAPAPDPVPARSPDLGLAFSPRQILGGFALIAGLILVLLRRRSGRKR